MSISVIFFGTPDFSTPSLEALVRDDMVKVKLVVTQPDRPSGRGKKTSKSPVKTLAMAHNIPLLQPQSLKKELEQFLNLVHQHGPFDIGVVVAFGQILPMKVLTLPKMGCVNVHASLLPRWRGAAPIQRAIMEGDTETGICLMQMDEGLDTGPVFTHAKTDIGDKDTFKTIHDKLSHLGGELLTKYLTSIVCGNIVCGKLKAQHQAQEGVTYASKVTPQDALINWDLPARKLSCLIRGLYEAPGAYTLLKEQRLKIYQAVPKEEIPAYNTRLPGTITFVDKTRLEVQCQEGILSIEELQLEGKKRMQVSEFLKGQMLQIGMVLGK